MPKLTKKAKNLADSLQPGRTYKVAEALELVKRFAVARFDESVDVAVNLGVDPKKTDQNVRGATVLPHGTGKSVTVAVFADGDTAVQAKAAGADYVGMEDLADQFARGSLNVNVVIATPASMKVVGKLGQVLGPKGLMPNPKVGTVTTDVSHAVKNAKAGQVRYRTDKNGIIHSAVGKSSFSVETLKENIEALVSDLKRLKPSTSKGIYLKRLTVSSTMGPGLVVEIDSLAV